MRDLWSHITLLSVWGKQLFSKQKNDDLKCYQQNNVSVKSSSRNLCFGILCRSCFCVITDQKQLTGRVLKRCPCKLTSAKCLNTWLVKLLQVWNPLPSFAGAVSWSLGDNVQIVIALFCFSILVSIILKAWCCTVHCSTVSVCINAFLFIKALLQFTFSHIPSKQNFKDLIMAFWSTTHSLVFSHSNFWIKVGFR